MKYFLTISFALLTLTACGFEPVYGVNKNTSVGAEEKLALVSIGSIPDRDGQYLRNALIDRFYRDDRPTSVAYNLTVTPVQESLRDLDVTKTADSTRAQLRLDTIISLSSQRTGQVLLERKLRTITSYNVLGSEFATRVSEQNARDNALDDLAQQIETQLSLYFKRTQ